MLEYNTDFNKKIREILKVNPGLVDMLGRAIDNPASLLISTISDHKPSVKAVEMANEWGVAKVTSVGPETGTEKEKQHYADGLAVTLREREENKIEKINDQIRELQGKVRDKETQGKEEELKDDLAKLKQEIEVKNFKKEAEDKLFGDFGPVWLAVLMAYAEDEFQGVVGGGDCPSAEFIRALARSTSKLSGKLGSTYVFTGPKPEGMSESNSVKRSNGEIVSSKILAVTDPAFETDPSPKERAEAAFATVRILQVLFPKVAAKIAFASYSTGSSGNGPLVKKDKEAYKIFKDHPDSPYPAYGPIQFDAATDEQTAKNKLRSFLRDLEQSETPEQREIIQEDIDAYKLIAGLATIISVQNLEVGNNLVKAMNAFWPSVVEMGPLILPHDSISSAIGSPVVASDLSRGEGSIGIFSAFAALSLLKASIPTESIQVE